MRALKNWRLSFGPKRGRVNEMLMFDIMNGGYIFQTVDKIAVEAGGRFSIRRLRVGNTDCAKEVVGQVYGAGSFEFAVTPFVVDPCLRIEIIVETFDEGEVYGTLLGDTIDGGSPEGVDELRKLAALKTLT